MKTKGKREELAPVISNFLFHDSENSKEEQKEYVELKIKIREFLTSTKFRKIISQILFDLQKDVAGGTRQRLFRLYRELGLHHDAFRKLKSWRWETVSQGILELSQMEVPESYQLIQKFINDRRGVVRKQAELAIVGLREDGIAYLLDTTRHSISEWQQIKLIEILGKRKDYIPPQFNGWLLSQNKDVVLFALRLIKHYNQKGAEHSINELVKHKDDEIKLAAVNCIVDFNFKSAVKIFRERFWKSSNRVKISILNAMAILGSESDLLFLKNVAEKEKNFDGLSKAQSTINAIVPETILPTKDIIIDKNGGHHIEEYQEVNPVSEEIDLLDVEIETAPPEAIEVEDLEYFDEIEIPKKEQRNDSNTSVTKEEEHELPFEIKSIEEEYGNSMDHLLGMVTSENTIEDTDELVGNYQNMSPSEKTSMIEGLGDKKDKSELPLLEHIAGNEADSNSEIGFHAFKTLQTMQDSNKNGEKTENNAHRVEVPLANQSVFYDLYHYTTEKDARLILLKELMDIGDERDVPFLKSLLEEKEIAIVKIARKAIEQLEHNNKDQISDMIGIEPEMPENTIGLEGESESQEEIASDEDNRIPMELFMLYEELGIASASEKEESFPFDFELSHEFFLNMENSPKPSNE